MEHKMLWCEPRAGKPLDVFGDSPSLFILWCWFLLFDTILFSV